MVSSSLIFFFLGGEGVGFFVGFGVGCWFVCFLYFCCFLCFTFTTSISSKIKIAWIHGNVCFLPKCQWLSRDSDIHCLAHLQNERKCESSGSPWTLKNYYKMFKLLCLTWFYFKSHYGAHMSNHIVALFPVITKPKLYQEIPLRRITGIFNLCPVTFVFLWFPIST